MADNKNKEVITMAVMSKPKAVVPILSEENTKKILAMPVNKEAIREMKRISEKLRGTGNKKS